ncbi:VOC family protein [Amorphus orientalis]|uniref:VOC domain-containing protein n=1 Tax=Amorphus orientalis TaxID=649198 RepID=A0AAE3VLW7_9HYPH|nr:hypothetical protein [Amorphus orientalis]MDQ0314390.1 hypothetical protein [Amorphus orientalis]
MTLLHVSISASDPARVAAFLAEVLAGEAQPFPPFPGCWIAFAETDDGTAVEVYPTTHRLVAGPATIACAVGETDTSATFAHVALASPLDRQAVIERATSEGWLARICNRGPFECVEVWIEGRLLVEILDPGMQADYRRGMTTANWKAMFSLE